ncbi:MAG: RrF2 family transcriptional regulator [Candidatus Villigracilaceae bacterium]
MFRVNRQTDYAVRVVLALAKQPPGTRLSSAAIGREMLIPKAFLPRIVAQLAQGGFISTFPGRDGGLKLARPAAQINLRQVVTHMEGEFLVSECLHGGGTCPFDHICPVRNRWSRLQTIIQDELENTTFDQLAQEALASVTVPFVVAQAGA